MLERCRAVHKRPACVGVTVGELVRQAAMLRFLDLLCKELGAVDARAEIGGRDPEDSRVLWINTDAGFRLVAQFAQEPADRPRKQALLEQLVSSFSQSLGDVPLPVPPSTPPAASPFKRLDETLEALRTRTGAVGVVVVDAHSPMLWGSSEPQRHEDGVTALMRVGEALRALLEAGVALDAICAWPADDVAPRLRALGVADKHAEPLSRVLAQRDETALRHHLLTCLAVARARAASRPAHESVRIAHHETQFGFFARGFANIYLLIAVFEGAYSELYVESAVLHALPGVEHLLLALPPQDPGPGGKGGRVIRLRR